MGAGYMGPGFGLRYPVETIGSDDDFRKDVQPKPEQGTVQNIATTTTVVSSGVKIATPETYELYPTSPSGILAA